MSSTMILFPSVRICHFQQLVQSTFTNFQQEDPLVDKLRTQLGVIHPLPAPPVNTSIAGFFVFFFFVGVVFDKLWTSRKKGKPARDGPPGMWPQVPTSFSLFLETDLQRKESVEWVNMVLGKLWKVYRSGLENWIVGLLQPVIDNLKKPDYVKRVEIKQFSLGNEPLSVRNVEHRTSRRVNAFAVKMIIWSYSCKISVEAPVIDAILKEGRMRGQAFVTFPSIDLAHHALKLVNGYVFKGKPMIIQFGRNPASGKTN